MFKKCKYCGKLFDSNTKLRNYCSEECKELGYQVMHNSWRDRHADSVREQDRLRQQKKRSRDKEEREAVKKEHEAAAEARRAEITKKQRAAFLRSCESGDRFSLMLKAKQEHGNASLEYFKALQDYYLTCHPDVDVTVNGIPITEADFAYQVMDDLSEFGCITIKCK